MVEDLTAQALRAAFGAFADGHAKSSVLRAWSTWNQFPDVLCGRRPVDRQPRWERLPGQSPSPDSEAAAR